GKEYKKKILKLKIYKMVAYQKHNLSFSLLVVFVLFGFSSVTRLSFAVTQSEVQTICSSPTSNPSFCYKFFKSDPKIEKLDLSGTAKYLIHLAQQNALDTHNQLQSLANSTTDKHTKECYISCSTNYDKALYSFGEALKDIEVKNPDYLNVEISAARQNANDCKTLDLKDVKPDPKLMMKIDFLENVCGIVLSISDILPKN
ncbi:Pectinesterase inhibitor domain, partial [Arabidopsis thaliana x Arabidopsis arenosa]